MKKVTNNSTIKKKVTTERTDFKPIQGCYTWHQNSISEHVVEQWADELRRFPYEYPEAKSLTQFLNLKQIYKDTFYNILKKNEKLRDAHAHAKFILGEKLWERAVDNKANWKAVHHRLWSFDEEFVKDDRYHVELAKEKNEEIAKSLLAGILHSNKDNIHDNNK